MPREDLKQPGIQTSPDYNPFKQNQASRFGKAPHHPQGQQDWEKLYADNTLSQKTGDGEQSGDRNANDALLDVEHTSLFFQLHQQYILTNVKAGIMLIDQQKAHERILYEAYLEQLSGNSSASQQQLFPQTVHFSPDDAQIIRSLNEEIEKLGFVIDAFGLNSFMIKGTPSGLKETDVSAILERIVQNHKEQSKELNYDKNVNLARSMAVNLSTKAGTKLDEREMADIFQRLFSCKVPQVSPDGKNILAIISLAEIEKYLK